MIPDDFITATAVLMHFIGDYVLQSDWMAQKKAEASLEGVLAVAAHCLVYTLPFVLMTHSRPALAFIFATHLVIDHFRLARYVVFAKNFLGPRSSWKPWAECSATGYHKDRPAFMAVWLYIIADNTAHVICNGIALHYWGT